MCEDGQLTEQRGQVTGRRSTSGGPGRGSCLCLEAAELLGLKPQKRALSPPGDTSCSFRARSDPETDPVAPPNAFRVQTVTVTLCFQHSRSSRTTRDCYFYLHASLPLRKPLAGSSLFQKPLTWVQMSKAGDTGLLLPPQPAGLLGSTPTLRAAGRFCPSWRFCTDTDPRWRSLWDICPWVWRGRCPRLRRQTSFLSRVLPCTV